MSLIDRLWNAAIPFTTFAERPTQQALLGYSPGPSESVTLEASLVAMLPYLSSNSTSTPNFFQ